MTIRSLVVGLQEFPTTTARTCMRLLGHMAAGTYVVQHARLRMRPLQGWLKVAHNPLRSPLDAVVTIPQDILRSLDWWKDEGTVCAGVRFTKPSPSVQLVTDALDVGLGAHLGNLRMQVAERMCGQPVLAQRIASWITSCIRLCYEGAGRPTPRITAHSTRAQATSAAFLACVLILEICRAATWSSVHTFAEHYAITQLAREDAAVGMAVLCSAE
nr:uncharacterized protein LOC112545273 [Pelodiscus sinensis]|eukprot:XP_025038833.1 uncharacterized protein LOC112545273 [Pelodiscus sinensis]